MFKQAQWIWPDSDFNENEYGEFYQQFSWKQEKTTLSISVRGDYTLFVNGMFAASNQYADFEHYKIYDDIDLTPYLKEGENTLCIIVWYFGASGMRYLTPKPGLLYEIKSQGGILAYSSEKTLSRKSLTYHNGLTKKISPQLGYSFSYDATKEDAWLQGDFCGFTFSAIISEKKPLLPRPIQKHQILPFVTGKVLRTEPTLLIDLGEEMVGLCSFSLFSKEEQTITVGYGELLDHGHVKRILPGRDFSFCYKTKIGQNEYTNHMFRLACRYLEIEYEKPLTLDFMGLLPQVYPVKEEPWRPDNELDKEIYEICLNTLTLCMMEHYVDCPWREQCLYAFDSRNQMLVGYRAFSDKNKTYARSNLLLMSKDNREDRLLSICFPSGEDLTIPSFSLYYIVAIKEYLQYCGDCSLAQEVFSKLESILTAFTENMEDGLVCKFPGSNHWNFYDWSPYASSSLKESEQKVPDMLINCISVIALEAFAEICEKLGKENRFDGLAKQIRNRIKECFYHEETGLFFISVKNEQPTELANSLAILADVAPDKEALCEKLISKTLVPCSLSMKCFKYDALIKVNQEKYKAVILEEIRTTYNTMLDAGSTTVWETAEGHTAFHNAGSLCHGWSAIPIYYYHKLSK
ncbi:MAG: hypothetical protein E7399_01790 [Ruminococcaceae bacterium]|nr:hypothetical protein [Oscillospiraceae bacterium]